MRPSLIAATLFLSPTAFAQTGMLDQFSPAGTGPNTAAFNVHNSGFVWQQQVRVGIAGQLEGFVLVVGGPPGAQMEVRVRVGDGPNANPEVFMTTVTKAVGTVENMFVNTFNAAITLALGDTFVFELKGNTTGASVVGSHVDPAAGPPLYPEPMFLNAGPGCYADCGWRVSFSSYMTSPASTPYCTAKLNSLGCLPAIGWTGTPSATAGSGFVVDADNIRNNKNGILFYGVNGQAAASYQGGILCVKSPIKRTPSVNSGGTPAPVNDCTGIYMLDMNTFAVGGLGGNPLPALTMPGTIVDCQWWGRDPGFPAPNNTTLSNGLEYVVGT